jgi:hypothetical protein
MKQKATIQALLWQPYHISIRVQHFNYDHYYQLEFQNFYQIAIKKTYDNVEGEHHTKGANWQVLSNLTIDGNLNRCDYLFSQPRLKNISLSIIDYQSFFLNEKINPLIISFKNISCERHHGGFSISVESFIYYAQHEVYRPLVFTLQAHVYA